MEYWLKQLDRVNDREVELENYINSEYVISNYPHDPNSYRMYMEYTNHNTLPFSGGYSDQPLWFWDDVSFFRLFDEYENGVNDLRRTIHKTIENLRDKVI